MSELYSVFPAGTVSPRASSDESLYERVSTQVLHLIERGTFKPGDRIPSVRRLSRELGVSITTVLGAYRLLENRGVIEARPQSGYYVRVRPMAMVPEPEITPPPSGPEVVSNAELAMRILRNARDPRLVPLGAAMPNPDLLPVEKLNRCLSAAARRLGARGATYDVPPGWEPLRVQIAKRALETGCTLTPDEIIITNGCLEAVGLALQAVCRPGDTVAIESPTFYGVIQAIDRMGLKVLEIPTHCRTGMSVEALRFALDQNPVRAVICTPNFNNPLGSLMPDEAKRDLVALLAERSIPLIEDDIYGPLHFGPDRPRTAKSYDRNGLVLLCSSFSKDLAPGFRVGWVAAGRFRARIEQLKAATNVASATLPQVAVADFLENGGYDHHLRRIRRLYAQRTVQVFETVMKSFPEGTRGCCPQGGFVQWIELPEGVGSLALYEKALCAGIGIAPGPMFSPGQRYQNFIRLSSTCWSDEIERSIIRLGQLVRELMP